MKRKYTFWFHYNKAQSVKAGIPKLSIHYKGVCHIMSAIDCRVNTYSYYRRGEQPNLIIKGVCSEFKIIDDKVVIT